jgi:methylated-DNA-protein-cysteine methyltransferase-like protein
MVIYAESVFTWQFLSGHFYRDIFIGTIEYPMQNPKQQHLQAIYLALASVPAGRVVTYGQLAAMAGLARAARLAGRALRDLPEGTELPWHRVINAQGRISLPEDSSSYQEQKRRLAMEGIQFNNNKINLRIYGYNH